MSEVRIEGIIKRFGNQAAVDKVSLHVREGEFVTLLGPSGCGKSTMLRMVAGFERADAGRIFLGNKEVTHLPARERGVGIVFQSYALFPNMNAFDNIAFGLRMGNVPRKEIESRVQEVLEAVELTDHAQKHPGQLSGGMQQRVALARAIVRRPPVLLLDEPLSALDAKIRIQLRQQIKDLQMRLGITTIAVTHDQEEALELSDRVAVMEKGRIVQVGAPHEIYSHPATRFVARFVGTLNFLPADIAAGRAVRPESVMLYRVGEAPERRAGEIWLTGLVGRTTLRGNFIRVLIWVGDQEVVVDVLNRTGESGRWQVGTDVNLCILEEDTFPIVE